MAMKYWLGESPIGKLVRETSMEPGLGGRPAAWLTAFGVVGDVRTYGLESEPQPEMYVLPSDTRLDDEHDRFGARQCSGEHAALRMRRRATAMDPVDALRGD